MKQKQIEKEIEAIKKRNKKVEADKAWETSNARKLIIGVLTYIVIVVFFVLAELPNPYVNAFITAFVFVVSTLSMPYFKKYWVNKFYKN
ncbi:MAG: hypothetical protein HOE11_02540 [Candidatus Diapherotrites archaeon]|jgi:hypothetical protein|nr:hypothetical protein [Candidatus Diapherotrites archaeon]MBT4596716.1 hypothetical protein [Candidatus Diapherotrites archaeon]